MGSFNKWIRPSPAYYACYIALRGDHCHRFITYPYYTKYNFAGDETFSRHIDVKSPQAVRNRRSQHSENYQDLVHPLGGGDDREKKKKTNSEKFQSGLLSGIYHGIRQKPRRRPWGLANPVPGGPFRIESFQLIDRRTRLHRAHPQTDLLRAPSLLLSSPLSQSGSGN